MKKRALRKRFDLNKTTIANLTDFEKEKILAGEEDTSCGYSVCYASGSAVWKASSVYYISNTTSLLPANPRYWPCYVQPPTDNLDPR